MSVGPAVEGQAVRPMHHLISPEIRSRAPLIVLSLELGGNQRSGREDGRPHQWGTGKGARVHPFK